VQQAQKAREFIISGAQVPSVSQSVTSGAASAKDTEPDYFGTTSVSSIRYLWRNK